MERGLHLPQFLVRAAILSCFLLISGKGEASVEVVWKQPFVTAPILDTSIKVDGALDESSYELAARASLSQIKLASPLDATTEVYFFGTPDALCIAYRCWEPRMEALVDQHHERDGAVHSDDCIELFVDANFDRRTYFHFIVNVPNIQYDEDTRDASWNAEWESATDGKQDSWVCELRIPWQALGLSGIPRHPVGINFFRSRKPVEELSAWCPTFGGFHAPDRSGAILFRHPVEGTDVRTLLLEAASEEPDGSVALVARDPVSASHKAFVSSLWTNRETNVSQIDGRCVVELAESTVGHLGVALIGYDRIGEVVSLGIAVAHVDETDQAEPQGQRHPAPDGMAVWSVPSTYKVFRDDPPPTEDGEPQPVRIEAAANEVEAFQLVIRPEDARGDARVRPMLLVGPNGESIGQDRITVHRVEYVKVETPTDDFGCAGDWPDPLPVLSGPLETPADTNTVLWISVSVPADATPGVYKGQLHVEWEDGPVLEVPTELEVFGFALPDETHTRTAYGVNLNQDYHGPLSPEQVRETWDLYMQVCRDHRISPYSPHWLDPIRWEVHEQGDSTSQPVVEVFFDDFDHAMERYLDEFHFNAFNMGHVPWEIEGHPRYSDAFNRLFIAIYSQVEDHLSGKGWLEKAYWYWVDEPTPESFEDVSQGMRILKEACPGMRRLLTLCVDYSPNPRFYDLVDLWVPVLNLYDWDRAHERQKLGEEIWWYVCCGPRAPYPNNFIDHPALNHRIRFWWMERAGVDGSLYWSITWWAQNPWETAMSINPDGGFWGNGDGRLLYPPRKSKPDQPVIEPPVTSIRLEMIREGLEDREYFHLLRRELERTASFRDDGVEGVRRRGQQALSEALELIPDPTRYEKDPEKMYAARRNVARAIEGLRVLPDEDANLR